MPRAFQTFKTRMNPATDKRELVLDRKGRPIPHKCWRYTYTDAAGDRRTKTGGPTKEETELTALRAQAREAEIKMGLRPAPKSYDEAMRRPFGEVSAEYQRWGESQGGRGGRPWGTVHARMRRTHLAWWAARLTLTTLADVEGALPRVEAALRELQNAGSAGKTLANRVDALAAFCGWCVDRGYLADDPLRRIAGFNTAPTFQRRALTPDEIGRLLKTCRPRYRMLYETALCSGLRAGELKALRVQHLDLMRGGLYLDGAWTKNRKAGFQPLPAALVRELADASTGKAPDAALLDVPHHTARAVDIDLATAGIGKWTPEGMVDFHALRTAYVSLVLQEGATVKEAQSLARHSTPGLTMNTYGRTRADRLTALAEDVGRIVLAECATGAERPEAEVATARATGTYGVEAAGIEPASRDSSTEASTCVFGRLSLALGNPGRQGSPRASPTKVSPHVRRAATIG